MSTNIDENCKACLLCVRYVGHGIWYKVSWAFGTRCPGHLVQGVLGMYAKSREFGRPSPGVLRTEVGRYACVLLYG